MKLFKILYVEDKLVIREAISELIQAEGRKVISCANAEDAWDVYIQGGVDLVVTDISLPASTGIDLTRRIVAIKPEQWVVLCSGYALPSDLLAFGANVRSLLKPFELEDFEALISEISSTLLT